MLYKVRRKNFPNLDIFQLHMQKIFGTKIVQNNMMTKIKVTLRQSKNIKSAIQILLKLSFKSYKNIDRLNNFYFVKKKSKHDKNLRQTNKKV